MMIVSPVSNLMGLAHFGGDGDGGLRIFHEILEIMKPFPKA
jgi:hypothetical protein